MAAAHYLRVSIFNVETGEVQCTVKAHSEHVRAVAWSPCGQWLASGGDDEMIYVYNTKTFEVKWPLNVGSCVLSVQFSPSGDTVAAGCDNRTVHIIDVATAEVKRTLSSHSHYVNSVAWSPDGTKLASGSEDKTVRIWERC